jgi:hypothetical protein
MQDACNFDTLGLRVHTIDHHERRSRDHQLARSSDAPTAAGLGVFTQEHVGAVPNGERHGQCAARIFLLDVVKDAVEIGNGLV